MLKENDRIACRFKDDKRYVEGYIKKISGKMLSVADSNYRLRQWVNIDEVEIEILELKKPTESKF